MCRGKKAILTQCPISADEEAEPPDVFLDA